MEWSILFLGSVGSGKTQAIRTISDIEVVDTEAVATDETALLKHHTTVAMDMGVMRIGPSDKLRLYGAPGQDRFDFMWDILLEQSKGIVLLVDHSRPDPVSDMRHYLTQIRRRVGPLRKPIVIGITHVDEAIDTSLDDYLDEHAAASCTCSMCRPPLFRVDTRERRDVTALLLTLTAMLEMNERFPARALHSRLHA
ncbi:GTP-binding protein [Caldimonas tepidiphila]|uniref:GTP-binding protein n=1 Tax=Caldimonas tepidiphila TaxID=2315841 RepID=UPI000E5AA436|nr:ATP/GTP-binding protein [Caldimonas tepidiphila]